MVAYGNGETRFRPDLLHLAPLTIHCYASYTTLSVSHDGSHHTPGNVGQQTENRLSRITGGSRFAHQLHTRFTCRAHQPRPYIFYFSATPGVLLAVLLF
jgi:hypothetical protein